MSEPVQLHDPSIGADPDQASALGVRWDLTRFYPAPDCPELSRDMDSARTLATGWKGRWAGRLASLTPSEAGEMLDEYEALTLVQWRLFNYASLFYAADARNPVATALQAQVRELGSQLEAQLSFFQVEVSSLEEAAVEAWWSAPRAARQRRLISEIRKYRAHILTEPEERMSSRKDLTGRAALVQLFDDLTNSLSFPFDDGTGLRERTAAEMLAYSRHQDPAIRRKAHEAYLGVFEKNGLVLSHILNSLCLDHRTDCEMRGYATPIERTHMGNSLPAQVVESMMRVTHANYPVAQRFWKAKARMLGMERLENTDLYAPIAETDRKLSWSEALDAVHAGYRRFSPELETLARKFSENGWIDAEVRPGKEDGAFCSGTQPDHHPYVLLNYTGNLRDVFTLAHELGHGVHFLRSAVQPLFLYDAPLVLAETASVFGEMLLAQEMLSRETDPTVRRSILASRIEDSLATCYRQNVLTEFELSVHDARRDGLLSSDRICRLWMDANAALFGDAVGMNPAYGWGWSYIPHFIHTRFYCYAYTFGQLLVLGLYQRWKDDPDGFVPRFLELLSKGGSEDPAQACASVGIVLDEDFWNAGHRALEAMVEEFEALTSAP
jgi:oligoendopeptidase F